MTTTHQTPTVNAAELKARLHTTLSQYCNYPGYYAHVCECGHRSRCDCYDARNDDDDWLLCSNCDSGISETDVEAGACTNCGTPLATRARYPAKVDQKLS